MTKHVGPDKRTQHNPRLAHAIMAVGSGCAGIMPSHENGRAKNAARDNNVMGFHSRIPDTILPLFLAHAMSWFPSHKDGFVSLQPTTPPSPMMPSS